MGWAPSASPSLKKHISTTLTGNNHWRRSPHRSQPIIRLISLASALSMKVITPIPCATRCTITVRLVLRTQAMWLTPRPVTNGFNQRTSTTAQLPQWDSSKTRSERCENTSLGVDIKCATAHRPKQRELIVVVIHIFRKAEEYDVIHIAISRK